MLQTVRRLACLLPLAFAGCFGLSQNPSYFPFYLPTGDIVRTHAKPPGFGYYANFDPHAVCLEVTPLESSGPTKSQFLVTASVTDEHGRPRRNRRVEWMLEGAGNIVEVDESGYFQGRGYKVDNKYAVSYTNYGDHKLRGTDAEVCAGQTWCVITSATEGDSFLTVYAPEVASWTRHKVFVTRHWCDADIRFPPSAVCSYGTTPTLATQVRRASDNTPVANYRVRYRLVDGPPAQLLPTKAQEAEVASDKGGEAKVTLASLGAKPGANRIAIEVLRPDPAAPNGPGIVVGRGETTLEWQSPALSLTVDAPPTAAVGQDAVVTLTVSNSGSVPTPPVTVRMPLPEGLLFARADRPSRDEGGALVWQLPAVAPSGKETIAATFRAPRSGVATVTATARTTDGIQVEGRSTLRVAVPGLQLRVNGPRTGATGEPLTFEVVATNSGNGAASNVSILAEFDPTLEHESKVNRLAVNLGPLDTGRSVAIPLVLTPKSAGMATVRVTATADGGLRAESSPTVAIAKRALNVAIAGPASQLLDQEATWQVRVTNAGDAVAEHVRVTVKLPRELAARGASEGGRSVGDTVVWELPLMQPREVRVLQLAAAGSASSKRAVLTATASAERVPEAKADTTVELTGQAALRVVLTESKDSLESHGKLTYTVRVTNAGTVAARQVKLSAKALPPHLKLLNATGATLGRAVADSVVFAPLERVEAGQTVQYAIEVEGDQPGDGRVRVEVNADGLNAPIVNEEATRVLARPN